jgi:hypothetical protein
MVALTYGDTRAVSVDTAVKDAAKAAVTAAPRKNWFARLLDAMIEARQQQARREIRMYTQLMPYTIDDKGHRILKTEMNTPFGGW